MFCSVLSCLVCLFVSYIKKILYLRLSLSLSLTQGYPALHWGSLEAPSGLPEGYLGATLGLPQVSLRAPSGLPQCSLLIPWDSLEVATLELPWGSLRAPLGLPQGYLGAPF